MDVSVKCDPTGVKLRVKFGEVKPFLRYTNNDKVITTMVIRPLDDLA